MLKKKRTHPRKKSGIIAALDVGSSKVSCAIAEIKGSGDFEILGFSSQLAGGIKAGVVIDMEEAITSIVNAVHSAEKMAGITVKDIIVSVNGTHLKSAKFMVEMDVSGHPIDEADTRRVLTQAKACQTNQDLQLLHMVPTGYSLDGVKGIRDPRGMHGDKLRVSIYGLFSKAGPLQNLSTCVMRSHLQISSLVAAPYASGLSCLVEDEMDLGALVIDMGGSTTSLAIFHDGQLRYADCIPVGGAAITMDIASCFSTTLSNAERLKNLFGSAMPSVSDDREMISVPLVGENRGESMNQMPRSALVAIIKPRVEEIFEMVRACLEKSGLDHVTGGRVILTGGGSQLTGIKEVASMVLGKNVRLGKPLNLKNSEVSQDPSLSACAGLLSYGQAQHYAFLQSFPQIKSFKIFEKMGSLIRQIW